MTLQELISAIGELPNDALHDEVVIEVGKECLSIVELTEFEDEFGTNVVIILTTDGVREE